MCVLWNLKTLSGKIYLINMQYFYCAKVPVVYYTLEYIVYYTIQYNMEMYQKQLENVRGCSLYAMDD